MATKQKNYRLPEDITRALDEMTASLDLDESEIVKRALRLALKQIRKDPAALVSRDASEEIEENQKPAQS